MAVKRRKAKSKTQKTSHPNTSTAKSEKSGKEDGTNTSAFSSSHHQPARLSLPVIMVSFVAVAVAAMYVTNNRYIPFFPYSPGYNVDDFAASRPLETPPTTQTLLHTQKWGNFNGIATITNAYNVLKMVDHDPTAFTQGLQVHKDQLVESTGLYGESLVRIWDPHTGVVSKETETLPKEYFGEGLTRYRDEDGNERYILLTWREGTAFVYDMDLNFIKMFQYENKIDEGWGITFDPIQNVFFVSDGTAYLHVWNLNFEEIHRIEVSYQTDPDATDRIAVPHINELEWDATDGTVLANVWYQNVILRIDPSSGQVLQIYDLTNLYVDRHERADCLNGIAHQGGNRWWLTGKLWPHLYLVEFLE